MCLPQGTAAKPVVCLFVFEGSFAYSSSVHKIDETKGDVLVKARINCV